MRSLSNVPKSGYQTSHALAIVALALALALVSIPRYALCAALDKSATVERDHWARIGRAQSHLARHDFVNASKALAPIGEASPAARDAETLREQLRRAMAFRVRLGATHFVDTQPFRHANQDLALSGWATTWLKTEFGSTALVVPSIAVPTSYWAYGGRIGGTLRLFDASLDLDVSGQVLKWNDAHTSLTGNAVGEVRWLQPLIVRVGQLRSEIVATAVAVARHAYVDQTFVSLALQIPNGLQVETRSAIMHYFDANQGLVVYGWALYPLTTGIWSFFAGYSGAYANTRHLRYNPETKRYSPYATPLGLYRHGPIVRTALALGRFTLKAGADYALQASDFDPSGAYWGVRVRRSSPQWEAQGDMAVNLGCAMLTASYRFLRRFYYDHHEFGLYLDVPIT